MYRHIQKFLDWGVKLASLAVTGPATWVVATQLFTDIQSPALLFLMRFAAVFLIEGVLLSNWLLLEFDKNATPEIKARYGITALAMYVSLLVIGWQHEGAVGLVFRVALLAALIGSGWDTYVVTWQKLTSQIDRSAENAPKVRRNARRLAIETAKLRDNANAEVEKLVIQRSEEQRKEFVNLAHQATMEDLPNRVQVVSVSIPQLTQAALPAPPQLAAPRDTKPPQSDNMSRLLDAYRDNPNLSLRKAGALIGVSGETVRRRVLPELEASGKIHKNGNGVKVL